MSLCDRGFDSALLRLDAWRCAVTLLPRMTSEGLEVSAISFSSAVRASEVADQSFPWPPWSGKRGTPSAHRLEVRQWQWLWRRCEGVESQPDVRPCW